MHNMIRKIIILLLMLAPISVVSAQDAKTIYKQGKALYDQEKYDKAFPLLKKAAEKGNKKAQYRLGRCYDKGRGVAENNQLAFQWYMKSAQQGYADAQYQVSRCYEKGKGVAADVKKAKAWLSKAVRNPKDGDKIRQKIKEKSKKVKG